MPRWIRIVLSVIIGIATLLYDGLPIDLIPDFLGPLGLSDDAIATVVGILGILKLLIGGRAPAAITTPRPGNIASPE